MNPYRFLIGTLSNMSVEIIDPPKYTIHYDSVGYDDNGILNTIQVITNPGASDIITLYPLSGADVYEDEEVRKPKEIKRMSQVDKFYKRYGNK